MVMSLRRSWTASESDGVLVSRCGWELSDDLRDGWDVVVDGGCKGWMNMR
jgi:hypothetical protein